MAGRFAISQLVRAGRSHGGTRTLQHTGSRGLAAGASQGGGGGDDIVKQVFATQQSKFRSFISELSKVKITLNPEDPKAVQEYAKSISGIRSKLQIPSYTEKLGDLLDNAGSNSNDVRSFLLLESQQLRLETGIQDDLGADKLMIDALDKVEKNIGKALLLDDQKGITMFSKEIDDINKKIGLDESLLDKLEAEVDLAVAKGELEELTKEAKDKMETYKRRDELDSINVETKDLDFRPYL